MPVSSNVRPHTPIMLQFHRTERYLKRMRRVYAGTPHVYENPKDYEDDVASFFINCHHLSDWIAHQYSEQITKKQIDAFINQHDALRVCSDLCNASKHCKIQRVRTGSQPSLTGKEWMIVTYEQRLKKPVTFFGKYKVVSGATKHDALELAESAFNLWRNLNRKLALKRI